MYPNITIPLCEGLCIHVSEAALLWSPPKIATSAEKVQEYLFRIVSQSDLSDLSNLTEHVHSEVYQEHWV